MRNMKRKQQSGFTLIELVVVIVILGILAATALPKFVDLSAEAGNAAANGVAGALASSTAANYAAKVAGKSGTVSVTGANVCDATTLSGLISGVTLQSAAATTNSQYQVAGTGNCTTAGAGGSVTCTVQGYKGAAQNATIICSG